MKRIFHKKELETISDIILKEVAKHKTNQARILSLSGDLGAGKTTITQNIIRQLGIRDKVVSPTFVIMKVYTLSKNSKYFFSFKKVIHIDAYRLDNGNELLKLGWGDISKDKNNLIIIEWPEKVSSALPNDIFTIKLGHIDEDTRSIDF